MSRPIVWSIAGSDSGGGAGIQADLHTLQALDVHGCTVITTVTAQNSVKTQALYPLTSDQLHSQLSCLLDDLAPAAIKIGLISNSEQLRTIARFLECWPEQIARPFIVWDPVLVSTQDDVLSELQPQDIESLLKQVNLVTPNLSELEMLSGQSAGTEDTLREAALSLCRQGAKATLVTGVAPNGVAPSGVAPSGVAPNGVALNSVAPNDVAQNEVAPDNSESKAVASNGVSRNRLSAELSHNRRDYFISEHGQFELEKRSIKTSHDHGTGCTLSSAIAAFAANHYPPEDCLVLASAYVTQGLQQASGVGRGPGPVAHTHWPHLPDTFPSIRRTDLPAASAPFAPLNNPPGLYPVVDSVAWLQRLLVMGVTTLQLRIKAQPSAAVEDAICEAIALGKRYNAQVFINDHWALAIKHGAFGVHLGQEDLSSADIAAIQRAGLRLGISTHSYTEILIALQYSPSYIALGHIFPTQTKSMPSSPQGVTRLARYVKLIKPTGIPTVAIGGIGLGNIDDVVRAEPDGVAVVTAITTSKNAREAVDALNQKLGRKTHDVAGEEVSDAD